MIKNCFQCTKEFYAKPAEIARGGGKFCSHRCSSIYGNAIRKPTGEFKICVFCNKKIYRTKYRISKNQIGFFCDKQCRANYEFSGKQNRKACGTQRRAHLAQKKLLIDRYGIICQFMGCDSQLFGDRMLIDMHHFVNAFEHKHTVLLCAHHHRLADAGYLVVKDGQIEWSEKARTTGLLLPAGVI